MRSESASKRINGVFPINESIVFRLTVLFTFFVFFSEVRRQCFMQKSAIIEAQAKELPKISAEFECDIK
jgi:hypothetical protein